MLRTRSIRSTRSTRRTGTAVGAFGVALGLGAVVALASPASAHNYLVSSVPAVDSVVTTQPGVVSVTTNDNLLNLGDDGRGSAIEVVGPDGAYYGDGCLTVAGPTASMPVEFGEAGDYEVVWQVVSTDGHPVSDTFTVTWQPAEGETLGAGSTTIPDCGGTVDVGSRADAGSGSATEGDESTEAASAAPAVALGDIAWIGGALGAVVVAGLATVVILRRRQS